MRGEDASWQEITLCWAVVSPKLPSPPAWPNSLKPYFCLSAMFLFIFLYLAHWRVDILMTIWVCPFATLALRGWHVCAGCFTKPDRVPTARSRNHFEHAGVPCRFVMRVDVSIWKSLSGQSFEPSQFQVFRKTQKISSAGSNQYLPESSTRHVGCRSVFVNLRPAYSAPVLNRWPLPVKAAVNFQRRHA